MNGRRRPNRYPHCSVRGRPKRGDTRCTVLEQYKVYVEADEKFMARRHAAHVFFLSLNTVIVALIGILLKELRGEPSLALGVLFASVPGILACILWHRVSDYHGKLTGRKYKIVHLIEEHLACRPFAAEWVALGRGNDPSLYVPFHSLERNFSKVFVLLYVMSALGAGFRAVLAW